MATCFVIQPFDDGPFDKRYDDVFVPAIVDAGLEPYRVDRDPSAVIPIEEIEQRIRQAAICLADISLPNPNVWFELGFAIAAAKPVVLVCSHDPARRFPFDIQHRTVVSYRTESARDFADLQEQIATRLRAALEKEDVLGRIAESKVVADVEGLSQIDIAVLATIGANAIGPDEAVTSWSIRGDMENAGYTALAATLGLRSLIDKLMVTSGRRRDERDGEEFTAYQVTPRGFAWLLTNQDELMLRKQSRAQVAHTASQDDDIPF